MKSEEEKEKEFLEMYKMLNTLANLKVLPPSKVSTKVYMDSEVLSEVEVEVGKPDLLHYILYIDAQMVRQKNTELERRVQELQGNTNG